MRAVHGHVQCRQRAGTDRAVGRQAVPLLEGLTAGFERRVEQRRVGRGSGGGRGAVGRRGQVARDLQALAQQRHARIAHARLQRRSGGDRRPAAGGLDGAIRPEPLASALVPDVRGRALSKASRISPASSRAENRCRPLVERGRRPCREVPLRAQLHRVHLAHVHVVQREHECVGGEQLEIGADPAASAASRPQSDRNDCSASIW